MNCTYLNRCYKWLSKKAPESSGWGGWRGRAAQTAARKLLSRALAHHAVQNISARSSKVAACEEKTRLWAPSLLFHCSLASLIFDSKWADPVIIVLLHLIGCNPRFWTDRISLLTQTAGGGFSLLKGGKGQRMCPDCKAILGKFVILRSTRWVLFHWYEGGIKYKNLNILLFTLLNLEGK